jgi:hypothetical protein
MKTNVETTARGKAGLACILRGMPANAAIRPGDHCQSVLQ